MYSVGVGAAAEPGWNSAGTGCPPNRVTAESIRRKESNLGQLLTPAEAATIPPAPDSRLESFVDAQVVAAPIAVSGVVDAIVEVSRQRKSLLNQLRSVLQSGNNAKALQLARQLCGLPG